MQRMPIDWSADNLKVDGKNACKAQILRFVYGIKGPRKYPATTKQIFAWVSCTPESFVNECIDALLDDGEMKIRMSSLSSRRRANGGYVYEIS